MTAQLGVLPEWRSRTVVVEPVQDTWLIVLGVLVLVAGFVVWLYARR